MAAPTAAQLIDPALQPHVVPIALAEHTFMHLRMLIDNGALLGPHGNVSINPNLRDLIDGIYQVLAGGTVTVQVSQPGNQTVLQELADAEAMCLAAVNQINGRYNFPLVLEV
jgi:hypothetical protein